MNNIEQAVSCFNEGYRCSQAILSTYGPEFGLNKELSLKISGPFGGGIGRRGETCGAVIGAIMVIGLKYGNANPNDAETKEKIYIYVNKIVEKFKERNSSILCKELLGCDVSTQEGRELAKSENRFNNRCPGFVRDVAKIIKEILEL